MRRREFLQVATLGGPTLAAVGLSSCAGETARRRIVAKNTSASFALNEVTISDLQADMQSGRRTARAITELYLDRIEKIDKHGPSLASVIELNPEALEIADRMDQERWQGRVRGPLHGIPVLLKDNIGTADRMSTTAGSLALEGFIAPQDSCVVSRLRAAGAVLLGKTNLSEWANFRSTRSTSGWSGRGGQTHNPYALDRNPSGSSSGSAVAVSANLCAVALGTETDGSIVSPSSVNGIVGIKPTVGLVSRSGIVPGSHRQDTAGPLARTVRDAAVLLGVLAGVDHRDAETNSSEGKTHADYSRFLDPGGMKGARLGVARAFFGFHDQVDKLMEEALAVMKDLGATLVDPADLETVRDSATMLTCDNAELEACSYELKADINAYLAATGRNAAVHSLQDLIEFNEAHREREMPYFGQELFTTAQKKGGLSSPEYIQVVEKVRRLSREDGIDATLSKYQLDALLAPTEGPAWLTDWINGDHFLGHGSCAPAARAGYPSVTVPAGFVHGLPVGVLFFSRAFSEPLLLRLAYAFEQATRQRRPPQFLARTTLA